MTIPRIIHQTIASKKDLHPVFVENISSLRSLNRGWDYRLYDDDEVHDFISSHYGRDVLETYGKLNPAYGPARADFFRYLLLYKTGGVYLDVKSTATKKLDDVLNADDEYILSHWREGKGEPYDGWGIHPELAGAREYQQWHVVAAPQHPFLQAVIERVQKNIDSYNPIRDGVGKLGVLRITGPIAYTLAIRSVLANNSYRLADVEDLGFRFSILGTGGGRMAHESYFKNHYRFMSEPLVHPRFIRKPDTPPRAAVKVGRNDPCPCGSGKKYKHCHGKIE